MALSPGTRLGAYEIIALIGAGGMGEVYRARDTRLNRDVALKVLPELFAADPDRLARFNREAHVLASLNHSNIATVHGFEETGGIQLLTLELVDGPTLADRIAQGALSIEEARPIARQIADALDAAHQHGVVHRDLKPANIKIRDDGAVKVLDFGLAKALIEDGAAPDVSHSPTLSMAATRMGVILGTAAYMAPEQAKGRSVDKRADIWAFGCVFYEMLTGRRAFEGDDATEILASIIKGSVELERLPADVNPRVRELIGRCLEKDPRQRIRDIGDVRYELDRIAADPSGSRSTRPPSSGPAATRRLMPVAAAAAITAVAVGAAVWALKPAPVDARPTVRFTYTPQSQFRNTGRHVVAVSPDGRYFAFNTADGLYLRSLDAPEARVIAGTEPVLTSPSFSPDGQWLVFFSGEQLRKIPVTGGAAVALCQATNPFGVSWAPDNTILFGQPAGVMQVAANGGTPELIIAAKPGEQVDSPQMLPGGRWVLFTVTRATGPMRWDGAEILAHSLETGERRVLRQGGHDARYVPTGHLIYAVGDSLVALPFDPERVAVSGGPVPVAQGMERAPGASTQTGTAQYAVSLNGTFVHVAAGASSLDPRTLVWVDRDGRAVPAIEQEAPYANPRVSPDGRRIATAVNQAGNEDIWIIDAARGVRTRLTTGPDRDIFPLWTRDGTRITFTSSRRGAQTMYWVPADGSGSAEPLTEANRSQGPNSWAPDGKTLAFHDIGVTTNYDIWTLMPGQKPTPFINAPFRERGAAFSPDGRWIAYASDESGVDEVYVQPYPGPGGKVTISMNGGRSPVWPAAGRELFYRNGFRMMAVPIETSPSLRIGTPRLLFESNFIAENDGSGVNNYDVAPDGRFLMIQPKAADGQSELPRPQINVVVNWFEELKRLVPAD
jgi:serine/threonine protein kinase/Tol biopolymer transport system component